jgi:hypothetical protein
MTATPKLIIPEGAEFDAMREAGKIAAEAPPAPERPKWDGLSYMKEDGEIVDWDRVHTGLMTYNTMAMRVDDFKAFELADRPSFYVFAGHVINSVEQFAADYRASLSAITQESIRAMKMHKEGAPGALHPNTSLQLMNNVTMRLEKFFETLAKYDGSKAFETSITIPYAYVDFGGNGRRPEQVNLEASLPYVNGMTFIVKWGDGKARGCCGGSPGGRANDGYGGVGGG